MWSVTLLLLLQCLPEDLGVRILLQWEVLPTSYLAIMTHSQVTPPKLFILVKTGLMVASFSLVGSEANWVNGGGGLVWQRSIWRCIFSTADGNAYI